MPGRTATSFESFGWRRGCLDVMTSMRCISSISITERGQRVYGVKDAFVVGVYGVAFDGFVALHDTPLIASIVGEKNRLFSHLLSPICVSVSFSPPAFHCSHFFLRLDAEPWCFLPTHGQRIATTCRASDYGKDTPDRPLCGLSITTVEEFQSSLLEHVPVCSLHSYALTHVEDMGVVGFRVPCIQRRDHQLDDPEFRAVLLVTGDNEAKITSVGEVGNHSLDVVYQMSARYRNHGWEDRFYLGSVYANR